MASDNEYDKGVYLNESETLNKKRKLKHYKIPYDYIVETTWGRTTKKRTVRCEIDYNNNTCTFQFRIKYGTNFQDVVSSEKSPSNVASIYEKTLNPNTKTAISGPTASTSVQKERESKRRGNLIKPAQNCVSSTLEKRAKKIATKVQSSFKNDINKIYHPLDKVTLNTIEFSVNQMEYQGIYFFYLVLEITIPWNRIYTNYIANTEKKILSGHGIVTSFFPMDLKPNVNFFRISVTKIFLNSFIVLSGISSIRCEIDYNNNTCTFQFRIKYGTNFQDVVSSEKSPSNVASIYEKTLNPNTKTAISGPTASTSVQKERESKRRGNLIKPAQNCVSSTLEKRAKKIATKVQSSFKNDINKIYHPLDKVTLNTIEFSVNQMEYQVNFGSKNKIKEDNHIQSVVKAIDRGQISRDSYRDLTATDYHLIREYSISNKRIEITKHMNQVIKFSLVNVKENNNFDNLENLEFEEPHITNTDIIREVSNIIGIRVNRMVYHGWELLKINQQWGLKAFSCSAVEKKNHDQVSTFFRKTLKNGGNPLKKKSAIEEIIEYENRTLYYNYNSFSKNNKIKKLHVK
ncbi:hypothetical protein Glove_109g360 [Diversispora epigaea]|uniref:Uncharacterized protein n=1 Tax=Diversispora epigaea TaxID=1348612 RepID=A0A397J635_9GLOM|nr:hypothetical protein Glove_109g360 [Diversispora epigaea]